MGNWERREGARKSFGEREKWKKEGEQKRSRRETGGWRGWSGKRAGGRWSAIKVPIHGISRIISAIFIFTSFT